MDHQNSRSTEKRKERLLLLNSGSLLLSNKNKISASSEYLVCKLITSGGRLLEIDSSRCNYYKASVQNQKFFNLAHNGISKSLIQNKETALKQFERLVNDIISQSDTYLEFCQTSKIERFLKSVRASNYFCKMLILDVQQSPEYLNNLRLKWSQSMTFFSKLLKNL